MSVLSSLCAIAAILVLTAEGAYVRGWKYQDDGVFVRGWKYQDEANWPDSCHNGKRQSPINIDPHGVIVRRLQAVQFHNYDKLFNALIQDNGYTVHIKFVATPSITGAILKSEYILDNVHFHWDSEHTVDGHRYPLEAHFVHYKKSIGSLNNAIGIKDGIVVLAVFYNVCTKCSPGVFKDISSAVQNVSHNVGREIKVPNQIAVKSLLPSSTQSYYTYDGSLTTPKCNEFVTWIVFARPANIERQQYGKLTNIVDAENKRLWKNFRPAQKLNGRNVYFVK